MLSASATGTYYAKYYMTASHRRTAGAAALTECHRGILTIEDPVPAFAHQPSLTCTPLGGALWMISDGIYTTVFCEGRKGLIAFDTFYSPGAATAYRKTLNRIFPDKPIHTIVYSHDHLDHTGYGADLAPEAEVIAHAQCAAVVAARDADGQLPVTTVFDGDTAEYEIDGVEFALHDPGATHGNGNVCAYFPAQEVAFMVDTVSAGVGYTFLPDHHLGSYVSSMRRALSAVGRFRAFVPGHFWMLDPQGVQASLHFHEALEAAAEEALVAGIDPGDFAACHRYAVRRLGAEHGRLFRFHEYAGMNLMRMMLHLREGGWGLEDAETPIVAEAPRDAPLMVSTRIDRRRPPVTERRDLTSGAIAIAAGGRQALGWRAPHGPVCVGTLGSPTAARRLARELGGPGAVVILACDHLDQAGFAAHLAPSRVIAHELTARALQAKVRSEIAALDVIRGAGGELEIRGEPVRLHYPGPTFGTGALAVHLPERALLYVVGPRTDARYGLIGDMHLAGATQRWRTLLDLDPDVVVFAHGGIGTATDLERACDFLDGLAYACQKAFAEGVAVWDVRAMEEYTRELLRGDFGDLEGFDDHVGISSMRVVHHYVMGGWGLEDGLHPPPELAPSVAATTADAR